MPRELSAINDMETQRRAASLASLATKTTQAVEIDLATALMAGGYFLELFNEQTTGEKDRRVFYKRFEVDMTDGKFQTPSEEFRVLLKAIDRKSTPFSPSAVKLIVNVALTTRMATMDLPKADPGVDARWVVNLVQPTTMSFKYPGHFYRVYFGPSHYYFQGAVQETNYEIESPGGKNIRVPTLATLTSDGARVDKQKVKVRMYRRITLTIDQVCYAEKSKEMKDLLKDSLDLREDVLSNDKTHKSTKSLKKATQFLDRAKAVLAKEGIDDFDESVEKTKVVAEVFAGIVISDDMAPTKNEEEQIRSALGQI